MLASSSSISTRFPMSIWSTADSPDTWTELEQLLYACLRTGDDQSAHLCLEQISHRFGPENERVMALRGLYQEAVAPDEASLRKILQDYNKILTENPMNVPVHKRRNALIRASGRPQEAIICLVEFLDTFPTDVEAWCELSDLYYSQGLSAQAIFCLEEALLIVPYAWNLHARLGELEYMTSLSEKDTIERHQQSLLHAVQRFGRSIELCDDYLRGYYGLKLASEKLLQVIGTTKGHQNLPISSDTLQRLSRLATAKLTEIVKARSSTSATLEQSEIVAAQELLNTRSTT